MVVLLDGAFGCGFRGWFFWGRFLFGHENPSREDGADDARVILLVSDGRVQMEEAESCGSFLLLTYRPSASLRINETKACLAVRQGKRLGKTGTRGKERGELRTRSRRLGGKGEGRIGKNACATKGEEKRANLKIGHYDGKEEGGRKRKSGSRARQRTAGSG